MTSHNSVRVPAAQAAAIVDASIATYARKAEVLAAATRAYRAVREPLATVVDARRDVIEAEGTLDALGWEPGAGDLELAGSTGAVREVLYTAMVAAADQARTACREYERGRIDRAALSAAVADVGALHELFAALEEADAPEAS